MYWLLVAFSLLVGGSDGVVLKVAQAPTEAVSKATQKAPGLHVCEGTTNIPPR